MGSTHVRTCDVEISVDVGISGFLLNLVSLGVEAVLVQTPRLSDVDG